VCTPFSAETEQAQSTLISHPGVVTPTKASLPTQAFQKTRGILQKPGGNALTASSNFLRMRANHHFMPLFNHVPGIS